jgi:hypothetical protein
MKQPSETKLKQVERELKKLKPGAQRAVGGGIYMRLTSSGERRFQFRTRALNGRAGQPAGTYATWQQAYDELGKREKRAGKLVDCTVEELRKLKITEYWDQEFLPYVEDNLDSLTEQDYRFKFERDCRAFWSRFTFEDVESAPVLGDRFRNHLRDTHTYPARDENGDPHPHAGQVYSPAACDGALKTVSSVFTHARKRGILTFNPIDHVPRFRKKRRKTSNPVSGGSHERIRPKQMLHPRIVVLAGSGVRGPGSLVEERRGLIWLAG